METIKDMFSNLNRMGGLYNISFGKLQLLSNSRMSLEACEYAAEEGRFEDFHAAVLESYFTDCEDIGDIDILLKAAEKSGLDKDKLLTALKTGRYSEKLRKANDEAMEKEVRAVPTFLIGETDRISGVQPLEVFERAIEKAGGV